MDASSASEVPWQVPRLLPLRNEKHALGDSETDDERGSTASKERLASALAKRASAQTPREGTFPKASSGDFENHSGTENWSERAVSREG